MFFTALEAQTLITGFGTLKVVGLGLLVSGGGCFVGSPPLSPAHFINRSPFARDRVFLSFSQLLRHEL